MAWLMIPTLFFVSGFTGSVIEQNDPNFVEQTKEIFPKDDKNWKRKVCAMRY